MFDSLLIDIIKTTEFRYEECIDKWIDWMHRFKDDDSSFITLCWWDSSTQTLIHELWHELHAQIIIKARNGDEIAKKEARLWELMYENSKKETEFTLESIFSDQYGDFISQYASKNIYEDFAVTFEYMYSGRKIEYDNVRINRKILFMEYLIDKYRDIYTFDWR